jgi:hypothetical protein
VLFGYPIQSTQNNWVHECVCEAIREIHALVDGNGAYPAWPAIVPAAYREGLKSRTGLQKRLQRYDRAVRLLTKPERDEVIAALDGENQIADLLAGASDCTRVDGLPPAIRAEVENLYDFAFGLLTTLLVRDAHYTIIYNATPAHICPFCGTEYFDAPGAPREAMDHYLAKSLYPFAAANLRNLVPMGHKCNSSYKAAKDLLRRKDGSHRTAFDPYAHAAVSISLDHSEPFGGTRENTPRWDIQFVPNTPESVTWDEIFSLKERYRRDHLDRDFRAWLDQFAKSAKLRGAVANVADLLERLDWFEKLQGFMGLQDRAFLKTAVFRMLRLKCEAGDGRLLAQLMSLVAEPEALAIG